MRNVTDPRITRTRLHVLETARKMLSERRGEALTFSSLSKEAQVSRRTLYVHWGTIEQVISDAVTMPRTDDEAPSTSASPRETLRTLLISMRDSLTEPVTSVAISTLVNHAAQNEKAAAALQAMGDARTSQFTALLGPIEPEQYSLLVGPIFFSEFLAREPASDALIDILVERGIEMLSLDDATAQRTA